MNGDSLSGFRLSPGQERLWRQCAAGILPEGLVACARFIWKGAAPEPAAVASALERLTRRHEILRTSFVSLPEMKVPLQAALEPAAIALDGNPDTVGPDNARLCVHLDAGGLILALSSLCGDGPTLLRLAEELSALLGKDGRIDGDEPLQYFDLAEWQHELLAPEDGAPPQRWAAADLQTVGAALPRLAHLKARAEAPFRPLRLPIPLTDDLIARLDAVSVALGAARADLLCAVWAALLWRLSDGAAAPVSLIADGRPYDELRGALGPLAGAVPLTLRPTETMTCRDLIRAVASARPVAQEGRHHLAPPTDECFAPFPVEVLEARAGLLRPVDVCAPGDRFLLKLSALSETDGHLVLNLDYDANAVIDGAPTRLAEQFMTLLAAVLAEPEAALDALEIVGPEERRLLVETFRGADVPADEPWRPVHLVVADIAERDPDRVVLQDDETTLSARELQTRVDALARRLCAAGVGTEVPVALYLPRGAALAQSMLAVLRAGGAYLPLSPELPAERVRFILADSGARHVVTLSDLASELPQDTPLTIIHADEIGTSDDAPVDFAPSNPEQAAYILYTSGSTGQPKGVVVTHASLANHMAWMSRVYPLSAEDTVLQKTAAGFDAAVWEFFAPLMQGARLVMARPGLERDVPALIETLRGESITVLQLVPSLLRVLVDDPAFVSCIRLRWIGCGGEALTPDLVRRFRAVHKAELVNLYGPTETTIQVCVGAVDAEDERISIGRPIDNVYVRVVDTKGRLAPVGARGEILIGGAALARGYLNRPDLTAERFVDDPAVTNAGRVYRTGDFGAWRADGWLDFFGRQDHQVKLRGYRVELGEIEAHVARHPAVAHAAVLMERDANGIDRLLCVYACREGGEVEPATLRAWLTDNLPDYMVPGLCRRLDKLPTNTSGKIDRNLLAEIAAAPEPVTDGQAPRDPIELRLERVWETVLDLRPVGVDRTFFDLGGHSLLAVRLMAEVKREFGCDLPLVSLFQAPTVAEQAALIRSQVRADPVLVPINRGIEGESPVFLVHPTGGSVLCYRDLARRLGSTRPIYALQDPGLDDVASYTSVEELAAFYIGRIRHLAGKGPYFLAGWSSGGIIAFEMARQLVARGEEVGMVALIDSVAADGPIAEARPDGALIQSVARLLAFSAGLPVPELAALSAADGMTKLSELAIAAGVLPPDSSQDQIRRVFNVFRRNVDVVRRYRPGAFPRRILLLRASEPLPDVVRDAAAHQRSEDINHGWGAVSAVTRRDIPAHHLSIVEEPAVALVGAEIRKALDEADRLQQMGDRVFFSLLGH